MKMQLVTPGLLIAFALCVLCVGHGRGIKQCAKTGVYIRAGSSCDREAAFLDRVANRAKTVLEYTGERTRERILQRWDGSIHELEDQSNAPAVSTSKRDIRLCLKGNPSEDAALFVIMHEMAHIACKSKGHTDEFWDTMREIIDAAKQSGVYTSHDSNARVCGKVIGEMP